MASASARSGSRQKKASAPKAPASSFAGPMLAPPRSMGRLPSCLCPTKPAAGRSATRQSPALPFAARRNQGGRPIAAITSAKPSKKRPRLELSEGPTDERRQHTPFTRDVLTPPGAPIVASHRTRTILTPLGVRRAIIEEAAAKPEAVRVRSLRRRLTVLDRTLSDREAEAIERLTSCMNSLSNV